MAEAVGVGGAEMGQRSARVTASAPSNTVKRLSTESLSSEGTWMPTFGIQGLDVSGHQPSVDWQQQWNMGARFAYVKATEGNYYKNPSYAAQYQGSRSVGMIRGAYHFAIPNWSSGADQARYFVQNGGGWSADGYTMPPVLDFEFNPYEGRTINGFYFGNTCYNMSPAQLTSWVRDFGNTMQSLTGRLPVIYTNTSWWNQCLGNPAGFGDYPLWVAAYPSSPTNNAGPVPTASWSTYSMWQYSSTGPFAGDSNVWNGDYAGLRAFASITVPVEASRAITDVRSRAPELGAQASTIICGLREEGCYQNFQAGSVVWSPSTGAHPSPSGPIRTAWQQSAFENGAMGYPTSAVQCGLKDGGCYQNFQKGAIIWSQGTGAQLSVTGPIRTSWANSGFEAGSMGYPTSGQVCGLTAQGCYQNFQNGAILWSPAHGAYLSINGPVRTAWQKTGFEAGPLGYPTGNILCGLRNGGCFQSFQNGSIASSSVGGAHAILGQMDSAWRASGRENGPLGYPTADETCGLANGGCRQAFEKGATVWSPATGAQLMPDGPIRSVWMQQGSEGGALGYPTGSQACGLVNDGCFQNFQGGAIIWSAATGAHASKTGAVRNEWSRMGFEKGALGYPIAAEKCGLPDNGCSQDFQNGSVTWTPARGAFSVLGSIFASWKSQNRETGVLAYPTSVQTCGLVGGGCYQNFQNGAIIWSPATGAQASPAGPIRALWAKTGYENGTLGYPTSGVVCGLRNSGCYQNYQNGAIIWSPTTGAQVSPNGPIRTKWGAMGYENSELGYPTGPVVCGIRDGGCYQNFQGGAMLWSQSSGAQPSTGQIRARYAALGYETSFLGYPITTTACTLADGACYQNYQGGSITWHPTTGTSVSTARR
jgi:uncharacterized protein with LGFP repeats/GH25 family lysozyme M1 (1,4-beta-N-acetylmuramidase)